MTRGESIQKAMYVLRAGGIIIYPTDTAFGIGCRIDNHQAVDRLFRIRRRPMTQAMPVLVDSIRMSLTYFDMPSDIVRRLMEDYWPGALTIVSKCKKKLIYSPIRGGANTVGLRMPDSDTILEIIEGVGIPILGPSANFHGGQTPYSFEELDPDLVKLVDYVVPACNACASIAGRPGECTVKQVSTVVDCSVTPYKIIRQGAVALA
jgi:L-threonylcarbamoyladenylate synthase